MPIARSTSLTLICLLLYKFKAVSDFSLSAPEQSFVLRFVLRPFDDAALEFAMVEKIWNTSFLCGVVVSMLLFRRAPKERKRLKHN